MNRKMLVRMNSKKTRWSAAWLTVFACFMLSACTAQAQGKAKDKYSYNLNRALECFQADEYDEAREYLDKELADNPKSALAYDLLGYIHLRDEEYGKALTAYTQAAKYYGKKEKDGLVRCNYYLARIHLCLEDTVSAISAFQEALRHNPEDTKCMNELANVYLLTDRFDAAESIYFRMLQIDPGSAASYYGLARIACEQKHYEKAKEYIAKSKLLNTNSITPFKLLLRVYMQEGDYKLAISQAVNVLSVDLGDNEAYAELLKASESAYQDAVNALIKKSVEDPDNEGYWLCMLGMMYDHHKDYPNAIKTMLPLIETDSNARIVALAVLADIYMGLSDWFKVLEYCNMILETEPEYGKYTIQRGMAEFSLGLLDEARADYEAGMKLDPYYAGFCLYRIGWIEETRGDYERALEYYNKATVVDEDYPYAYMMKGTLLKDYLNRPEEAKACFEKVIELEGDIIDDDVCRQYAYAGLGDRKKAIEVMDSLLTAMPDNAGMHYDAACLYCRLGDKELALHHLQTAFEKGHTGVAHVLQDNDMDLIRDTDEFKALIEKYSQLYKMGAHVSSTQTPVQDMTMHEIPLAKQSGNTYLIKASINNLPMDFVLDTGCSDISLSSVESDFMLKNGYLKKSDFKGNTRYSNATGEVHTAKEIIVREIKLGDLVLHNLRASVIPNQKAPLLLGQNVLTRFGKVEIDHQQQILRIGVAGK